MKKKEYHVPITSDDKTALDVLAKESGFSRQKVKKAMQKGCVWLEQHNQQGKHFIQRLRRAKKVLQQGMELHCYLDEAILETEPPVAELVADEGEYSIWNKPSGMLSQGTKWGDHCTIYRWAEMNLQPERPAFLVHRLDRAASGLILLAHKKSVAAQFSKLFQQREIIKHYRVRVHGDFSVVFNGKNELTKTIEEALDDKTAISHFKVVEFDSETGQSLLDVSIETGRKHQIRRHLSQLGFPVVGDRIYGNTVLDKQLQEGNSDLQLRAERIEFICPITHKNKQYNL